jgi:hypothetical protein
MKKLTMLAGLVACAAILVAGCGSTQVRAEYQKYKKLHVGWLDLGEQNWKKYGYPKQAEWAQEIKAQNGNLQKFVKGYFKGWTVTGVATKGAAAPRDAETLLVKFSNASLSESNYTVKCGIEYVDAASGKVVKRATVVTHEFSYSPWWGFGARVYNSMNALAGEVLVNLQK